MGDEFEGGILSGIGFGGETKAFVILGDIFRRDGSAQADPIDRSIDGVAD